jgi:hypothetical protein
MVCGQTVWGLTILLPERQRAITGNVEWEIGMEKGIIERRGMPVNK